MKTKKSAIYIISIILVFYFISTGWAITYYVSPNGNDGSLGTTSDKPFRTIQFAANKVVPGDAVLIAPGIYNELVTIKRSGTSEKYITFGGSKAAIINKGFILNNGYIKINNLTIRGDGLGNYQFILSIMGNNCDVSENIIEYTKPDGATNWVGGIRFGALSSNNLVSNNIIRNLKYVNIKVDGHHNKIDRNKVIGRGTPAGDHDAFHIWGHDNIISRNEISGYKSGGVNSEHVDAFQTHGQGNPAAASYNILIDSNVIHHFDGQIGNIDYITPDMHDWTFRNNIFYEVSGSFAIGMPNVFFYNNTFYKVSFTHVMTFRNDSPANNRLIASGGAVINNLFINCGAGRNDAGWYGQINVPGLVTDYNYVATGDSFTTKAGFSEVHGINGGNPKFFDLTNMDLRLKSDSPAKHKGRPLPDLVQTDIIGTPRPSGLNTMGAYEPAPVALTSSEMMMNKYDR